VASLTVAMATWQWQWQLDSGFCGQGGSLLIEPCANHL
jgi:hypothetical protein